MKKILLIIALLISGLGLNAQSVNIDYGRYSLNFEVVEGYDTIGTVTYSASLTGYSKMYTTSLTIPSSVTIEGKEFAVTSIGDEAFLSCSSLTSIEIPSGVTSIGNYAFLYCSSLTSVDFGDNSQLTSIGYWAFYGCEFLTSIEIPSGVTSIGESAFEYCSSLTSIEIPSGVTSIGNRAFYYCSSLTSIEIPSGVTSIGDYAFNGCSSLTSIVVEEGNTIYDSRENCNAIIETANNILVLGCKNTVIPSSVAIIGEEAFSNCSSLTSIEIPSSVYFIDAYAFYNLRSLICHSENVPSAVSTAFSECYDMTIYVPENSVGLYQATSPWNNYTIRSIGEYPGEGDDPEEPTDPETPVDPEEPEMSFTIDYGMYSLRYERIGQLRDDVLKVAGIDVYAEGLSVEIPSKVTYNDKEYTVTSIGDYAFSSCVSLTSIEIPSGVTSIGSRSFRYCSRLTSIFCYAEDVPVAVDNTFEFCPADMIIYVPANSVDAYKLTSPWNRYTIKAIPTHCEVTVAVSPDKAGVVTGAGSYEINGNVTVTAIANAGYTFVNWTENNKVVSEDAEYTFTITKDRTLVANFIQTSVTYNVTTTVNPEKVGVVIGSGLYFKGDNVTLTAIPIKNGYEFVNWTEDGEEVSTDAQYSFVIESDRDLVANFVLLDYYVSVAVSSAEAGEVTGDGNYNHGDTVALIATANEGYAFVNWTEDGEVVSSVAEYSFVILKDRNIVANFEKLEDPEDPEQPEEPGEGVEELVSSFNIYPNPVSDKLYIETQTQTQTVEIYDVYGRQQSMVNGQQSTVIDVSDLNSGVYFVKVVTSEGEAVKRFVKK